MFSSFKMLKFRGKESFESVRADDFEVKLLILMK